MGMAAILLNGTKPFEQIVNIPTTEGPVWNLLKTGQAVSEKKTFKDFINQILCSHSMLNSHRAKSTEMKQFVC